MSLDVNVIMAKECDPDQCFETATRLELLLKEKLSAALRDLEVEMPEIIMVESKVNFDWYKAVLFDAGFTKSKSGSRLFRVVVEAV